MLKLTSYLVLLTVLCITPLSLTYGAELSLGNWHATGSEVWRTSFPLSSQTEIANGTSELVYPQSGTYIVANYENPIGSNRRLRIESGIMSNIDNAQGSDSDWDYSKNNAAQFYGEFNTSGTSAFMNIDSIKPVNDRTEFFYGYGYRINHFRMRNGTYKTWNYASTDMSFENLDSYYTTTYQGIHLGLSSKVPINSKLSAISTLSYSPLAIAQGHGWWNLRDLDFRHEAPAQIFDGTVGIAWQPAHALAVSAGYRYQHMSISKGRENLSTAITWEKATNIQKGFYFNSTYTF